MKRTTLILVLLAATAAFGVAVMAQRGADAARAASGADELLYLPNERLLNHFTAGLDTVIADLLWLRCVQYVATESQGARNFTWLSQMLNTVVRLDPYFTGAYRYGGMFLATLRADDEAGLDLLERGIVQRPETWELPYEAAMVFLLNRPMQPDSKRRAAYYLGMSAATGKAPAFVTTLAAKLQGEYNLVEIEREMWTNLLEGDDQFLRGLATRKLQELDLRETCRVLNERLDQYRRATGRMPESLVELGLRPEALDDPLGGRFFVDRAGVVQNTSVLDSVQTQYLNLIRAALERYQRERGAWPVTLDTLVREHYMSQIPPQPYIEQRWVYEPSTGELSSGSAE
jgi:hypothetical protein